MPGTLFFPDRPRLPLASSPRLRSWRVVGLAGVVATLALLAWAWPRLPETVPTHFDLSGEPDAWGPKWTLLLLFVFGPVLWAALELLGRYPHVFNYLVEITEENAARQYLLAREMLAAIAATVAWLFAAIGWATVRAALAGGDDTGTFVLGAVVLLGLVAPLGFVVVYLIRSQAVA